MNNTSTPSILGNVNTISWISNQPLPHSSAFIAASPPPSYASESPTSEPPPYTEATSDSDTDTASIQGDNPSLPALIARRIVFPDRTSMTLDTTALYPSVPPRSTRPQHIMLSKYGQLDRDDKVIFMLENAALVCLCIRNAQALKQASGLTTIAEAKFTAQHPDQRIKFSDGRKNADAYQLGEHRFHFHSPIQAYDQYERKIQWLCTIPTCVSNLLPVQVTNDNIGHKQAQLMDSLDQIVDALQAETNCRQLMKCVNNLPRRLSSIILHEISNKFSTLHSVITEAFNDARFPDHLRNRQ